MNIVIMVQNMRVGGVQRLVADEIKELISRKHTVWLVIFESEYSGSLLDEAGIDNDHVVYIRYPRMRSIRGFFRVVLFLLNTKPDIVITHLWFANTIGRVAATLCQRKNIFSFEHNVQDRAKTPRQLLFNRVLQGYCTAIIAVSSAVKDSLVTQGIQATRIRIIHNGADLSKFRIQQKGQSLPSQKNAMLFIGRLVNVKGVDILLEALVHSPKINVCIAGDGPERAQLESQARQLGIESQIKFLGMRSNVPELLHSTRALVVPSRSEGFGLVIVEALAAGVPVVASDIEPISEIVHNEKNGLLVAPEDPKALAEAMERIVTDDVLYTSLKQGTQHGLSHFSIRRHVDELLSLAALQ